LNYLSNYIAGTWSSTNGCLQSKENLFDVTNIDDVRANSCYLYRTFLILFFKLMKWPMVYIALFIEFPTPFLREYFEKIMKITYPKKRLGILIHNQVRNCRLQEIPRDEMNDSTSP
jgi:hypothetical protein